MKKIILAFLLICSVAYASDQWTPYAIKDSEGVHILYINPNIITTPKEEADKAGFKNSNPILLNSSTIPLDKKDRKYWDLQGNSIVIDTVKRQADIDLENQRQAAKDVVLAKLGLTRQELKSLLR